jgi:hypothetical protein
MSSIKNRFKAMTKMVTKPPSYRYIVEEDKNDDDRNIYLVRANKGSVENQAVGNDDKFNAVAFTYNPLTPYKHLKTVTPKQIRSQRFSRGFMKLARGTKTTLGSTVVPLAKQLIYKPGKTLGKHLIYKPVKGIVKTALYNPVKGIANRTGIGSSLIKGINKRTSMLESGEFEKMGSKLANSMSKRVNKSLAKGKIHKLVRGGGKTIKKRKLYRYH